MKKVFGIDTVTSKKYIIRYRYDTLLLQYSVVDIIRYSIFLLKRTNFSSMMEVCSATYLVETLLSIEIDLK